LGNPVENTQYKETGEIKRVFFFVFLYKADPGEFVEKDVFTLKYIKNIKEMYIERGSGQVFHYFARIPQ